jgi:endonuclease-3
VHDKRVNMVTPALFRRYPDARTLADADTAELEEMIHSCGFLPRQGEGAEGDGRAVAEQHGGQVPTARAELAALPGVGPKTAGRGDGAPGRASPPSRWTRT